MTALNSPGGALGGLGAAIGAFLYVARRLMLSDKVNSANATANVDIIARLNDIADRAEKRAEAAEKRADEANRERNEAVHEIGKLREQVRNLQETVERLERKLGVSTPT